MVHRVGIQSEPKGMAQLIQGHQEGPEFPRSRNNRNAPCHGHTGRGIPPLTVTYDGPSVY